MLISVKMLTKNVIIIYALGSAYESKPGKAKRTAHEKFGV